MNTARTPNQLSTPRTQLPTLSPMAIVGAILAQGVIRLIERQKKQVQLDKLTEESVSTEVLTTQENPRD